MDGITYRALDRGEVDRVAERDRAEVIDHVYHTREGRLVPGEEHWELEGWPARELAGNIGRTRLCPDRGGAARGAFEEDRLASVAVLDGEWIGSDGRTLDVYLLHVGRYRRGKGVGRALTDLAKERARGMGARRLYVSATPPTP